MEDQEGALEIEKFDAESRDPPECPKKQFPDNVAAKRKAETCSNRPLSQNISITWERNGEPTGIRTLDRLIKSQMLYQLSYRLPFRKSAEPIRANLCGQCAFADRFQYF